MSFFKSSQHSLVINEALQKLVPDVKKVLLFSFFTNLLVLAPTWYMLEVYDRVVNSQNHGTLMMLTIAVIFFYVLLEALEYIRSKIMFNASLRFDQELNERVFNTIFQAKLKQMPGGTPQSFADLKTIKEAIASPAIMAIIDMPFALMSLILIFAINSTMGWFSVGGAILLGIITAFNQHLIQPPLNEANRFAIAAQNYANSVIKNAQVIEAMGMLRKVHSKWADRQNKFLMMQGTASDFAGINSSLTKFIQTLQGSLLLGLGAWLALKGEIDMGGSTMIIASILGGRVLSPIVSFVTYWRTIANTKDAIDRLNNFFQAFPEPQITMDLPPPLGNLSVEGAVVVPPNGKIPVLKGISFTLPAGQSIALVGPSASGKTTLARLVTGVWPAINGKVRLDGSDIYQWKKSQLGPYVGYLPQDVELFDGTIAENIARFGDIDIPKVQTAANIVGLDDFIKSLKDGFDTQIGVDGSFFSGGQRQRIALARAIYGMPKFVVLDEPNSSLDEAGDLALIRALQFVKSHGTTLIIVTHRMQILSLVDYIMVLTEGQIKAYGPRDKILEALNQNAQAGSSTPKASSGGAS